MRKILIHVIFMVYFSISLNAQIYTPSNTIQGSSGNNNVGIGVLNPQYKLMVQGEVHVNKAAPYIQFNSSDWGSSSFIQNGVTLAAASGGDYMVFYNPVSKGFNFRQGPFNVFTIQPSGFVGISSSDPSEMLELGGDSKMNLKIGRWGAIGVTGNAIATVIGNNIRASHSTDQMEFMTTTVDGAKAIKMQYNEGITFHTLLGNVTSGNSFSGYERMRIDNNGNVGIGTTNPDTKLAVKGTIHSEEVKVDLNVPAPDYVFEPTYELPTLEETKEYISENKHLPEIPSAKEMETDGINLGNMNMRLLKKIEELTLYIIEQNEQIEELKTANTRIDELEKKFLKLTSAEK